MSGWRDASPGSNFITDEWIDRLDEAGAGRMRRHIKRADEKGGPALDSTSSP
jgi:hypothetical protein